MSDALATSSQLLFGRTLRRAGMSNALATRRVPMSHSRRVDEFQTNKSTTVHMTRQLHSTVTRKHSCTKTKKKKRTAQYSCIPRSQDSTKKCILAPFFPLGLVPPSRSKWGSATEDRALAFCREEPKVCKGQRCYKGQLELLIVFMPSW